MSANVLLFGLPALGKSVSPALSDLGLDLLRCEPSKITVDITVEEVQIGYSVYKANLPAFLAATLTRERVQLNKSGYPLPIADYRIPLPPATLALKFSATDSALKMTLSGCRAQMIQYEKSDMWLIEGPSIPDVKSFSADPRTIRNMRSPDNTLDISAYRELLFVNRLFAAWFVTQQYPAFPHSHITFDFRALFDETTKRLRPDGSEEDVGAAPQGPYFESDSSAVATTSTAPSAPAPVIVYNYAKPQPSTHAYYGSAPDLPDSDGIVVPYVEALQSPDKHGIPDLISAYFLHCLGRNFTEQVRKMTDIRKASDPISRSRAGSVLAHMAKCIDLCISCQARGFIVLSGREYRGIYISGSRFSMHAFSKVYTPGTRQEGIAAFMEHDVHSRALSEIARMLGASVDDLTSMRSIHKLVRTSALATEITPLAKSLNFPTPYWSINTTTVAKALLYISDNTLTLDDKEPMHYSALGNDTKEMNVLSAFGYQAPSFEIPTGKKVAASQKTCPLKFAVRPVDLSKAVMDLRVIRETKVMKNCPDRLNTKFQERELTRPENAEVWKLLKMYCNASGEDVGDAALEELVEGPDFDDIC